MTHTNQGLLSAWGEDINRELDAAVTQTRDVFASLGSFYINMHGQTQHAPTTPPSDTACADPPTISPPLPSSVDIHLELFGKIEHLKEEQCDRAAALPKRRRSAETHHHAHHQVRIELPQAQDSTRGAQWVAPRKRHASGPKATLLQLGDDKNPQSTVLTPGVCTPNTASKIAMWMKKEPLHGAPAKPAAPLHVNVAERTLPPRLGAKPLESPPPQPAVKPSAFAPPAAVKQAAGRKSGAEFKVRTMEGKKDGHREIWA
ncbi:hypothetical protein T484DRAFT_1932653 [Baffinella frigidus]|nr:hypothetical protein T484DRAFT_1932653 [Cryptophyta sp. CCMP2293]